VGQSTSHPGPRSLLGPRSGRGLSEWVRRVQVQRVVAPYNISLSMEALDADITSARGAEVLWRQLADGVVLFCIAHSTWPGASPSCSGARRPRPGPAPDPPPGSRAVRP